MTLLVSAAAVLSFGTMGCASSGAKSPENERSMAKPLGTGSEFQEAEVDTSGTRSATLDVDLAPIYFDYDRFDIRADARPVLRANAEAIRGSNASTVTIEGHCDERGSDEYNMALGERRAKVVEQYLIDLGIPASRLTTVSFGEARPAVKGYGEYAWSMNRRSEIRAEGAAALDPVSSR